jgi:hypothetical protein
MTSAYTTVTTIQRLQTKDNPKMAIYLFFSFGKNAFLYITIFHPYMAVMRVEKFKNVGISKTINSARGLFS